MANDLNSIFGLQTYAVNLIRKSQYWERVDGSTWWHNPDTNAIEPFPEAKAPAAKKISPKEELNNLSDSAKDAIGKHSNPRFKSQIEGFGKMTPDDQAKVVKLLGSPAHTVVAATSLGSLLGMDAVNDLDLNEPLSQKLYHQMLETDLPAETGEAESVLNDVFYDTIKPLAEYIGNLWGDGAKKELFDIADTVLPYVESAVSGKGSDPRALRTGDIDTAALKKGFIEFEQKFFDMVDKYIG